jgi:hypothetical protein
MCTVGGAAFPLSKFPLNEILFRENGIKETSNGFFSLGIIN